jgi:hypothetical protein
MSEFSESFQAYTSNRGSVIAMLRGASVSGLIAGSNTSCVSFVIDDPEREDDVIAASEGVLARYHYGEDHGVWIRFHRDGKPLTAITLVWDPDADSFAEFEEAEPEKAEPSTQIAQKLARAGVLGDVEAIALCRALEAFSPEEPEERERGLGVILGLLGFAAHKWLSAAYAQASGPEEMSELFPGAEVVESE